MSLVDMTTNDDLGYASRRKFEMAVCLSQALEVDMSGSATGKNYLVIGATGNVGGLLTPMLLERGENVRCLIRSHEKANTGERQVLRL